MQLVIGGAYQGKLTWAMREFDFSPDEVLDLAQNDPAPDFRCYTHLEALTRRERNPERWLATLRGGVVIAREIGGGIVPLDAEERAWRERHGAFLQTLAAEAERVTRIFCGLKEDLK